VTGHARPRVAIIGGGIAGAALAYVLAVEHGVAALLLEREAQCGTQSTGRSAALYMPSYGPPAMRALTRASGAFYSAPPDGFAAQPLLRPRGALHIALEHEDPALSKAEAVQRLRALQRELDAGGMPGQWLEPDACLQYCPVLRPQRLAAGLYEAAAQDMDVDAILQGFLRGARAAGARVHTGAGLLEARRQGGAWELSSDAGRFDADVVVDAAGAWADVCAGIAGARPLGLVPKRRSAFVFAAPDGLDCRAWPAVIDADERFYFKPDAGLLLGSPANADATQPHDVQPEEIDIATGIWGIEQATTLNIRRPRSSWAGLRSFFDDGEAACGFDPRLPGWFWLAGLGGYGIQSAPGLARAAAALLLGRALPRDLLEQGFDPVRLDPARLG
jgi:D-arginine dehydrogenase